MAKIGGVAAELARQASEAALAEAKESGAVAAPRPAGRWQLPTIGTSFRLDEAVQQAVQQAANSMNNLIKSDGLVVNVPQNAPQSGIEVREIASTQVLRAYDSSAFLRLHATREQRSGVVVDGQV